MGGKNSFDLLIHGVVGAQLIGKQAERLADSATTEVVVFAQAQKQALGPWRERKSFDKRSIVGARVGGKNVVTHQEAAAKNASQLFDRESQFVFELRGNEEFLLNVHQIYLSARIINKLGLLWKGFCFAQQFVKLAQEEIMVLWVVVVLIFVSALFFLFTWFSGGPYTPVSSAFLRQMTKELLLQSNQRFYDLGSGDGRVLVAMAKAFQVHGVGYEINPVAFVLSLLWSRWRGTSGFVQFRFADLFHADVEKANVVFLHLLPHAVRHYVQSQKQRLRPGTRILSYGVPIAGLTEIQVIRMTVRGFSLAPNILYVYQV